MKIKTAELSGKALDWAVAVSQGGGGLWFDTVGTHWIKLNGKDRALSGGWSDSQNFQPSKDWRDGGPIIDMAAINLGTQRNEPGFRPHPDRMWHAQTNQRVYVGYGPTPLVAAMRCFVCARLGQEIDVPDELLTASEVVTESAAADSNPSPQRPRGG
jgi:hypothetical protein